MQVNNKINIHTLTESALSFMLKNLELVTDKIQKEDNNDWVRVEFPSKLLYKKTFKIDDFTLKINPESSDKKIDFDNSVKLYENLKELPRYVLIDNKFWLWLYLDKFYKETRAMMKINNANTVKDHWHAAKSSTRRKLMFGVLSRMYFRVALSVDENNEKDKYHITRWIIEKPERFRNLSWRTYSSLEHLTRGILKGQKRAVEDMGFEFSSIYSENAKYVSRIGSVKLLDVISEEDIEELVYNEACKLLLERKARENR